MNLVKENIDRNLSSQQSLTISLVKGLSILMVVLLHAFVGATAFNPTPENSPFRLYYNLMAFDVCGIAVPLFFFLSGFLFFLREESIVNKWKKRARSLLMPYLLWCFLNFLFLFVCQRLLGLERLFQGNEIKRIAQFTMSDFFRIFWDIRSGAPILAPLWFLRNLILLVAIAPAFAWLSKYLQYLFPILLYIFYLLFPTSHWYSPLSTSNIFFFAMGCWLSANYGSKGISTLDKLQIKYMLPIWLCALLISIISYRYQLAYQFVHGQVLIIGCLFIYSLFRYLSAHHEMTLFAKISTASFFIYLFHQPWLGYSKSTFYHLFLVHGGLGWLMPWVFFTVSITFCVITFTILKRFTPKLLDILTGARK